MKMKGIRILFIVALVLEVLALLNVVGMTAIQSTAKTLMTADSDIINITSVPIGWLIKVLVMLIIYGIGSVVCSIGDLKFAKVKAVIFMVMACVFQIMLQYTSFLNTLVSRNGVMELASYSMLENMISFLSSPLHLVAFPLFCVACGGLYCLKGNVEKVQNY